ncbi:MAG: PDZ domain-containing protein [Clostridia bacterium]|nr:PDZ domain-containing protein [Clostridia bacterium]
MESNERQNEPNAQDPIMSESRRKKSERQPYGAWLFVTAVLLVVSILLTFTLTTVFERKKYVKALNGSQITPVDGSTAVRDAENLKILESVLQNASLYADSLDEEKMLQAAFKAYVEASGDRYAVFYSEEEYRKANEISNGRYVGIGISFAVDEITIDDEQYTVFRVTSIVDGSPAAREGICVGDYLFAVKLENGQFPTISSLDYAAAVAAIRGEEGTTVELQILRRNGSAYDSFNLTCTREYVESLSAEGRISESDPTVAVVRISSFELNTPVQFCRAVDECRAKGATKFVFDVRDNPGGDLRSVRAILSNFLREDDLIIKAIDKDGNVAQETRCKAISYLGDGAGCNVTKEQIGQYRDLNFVVLCDENTASAAEVFTATLRDFGLSRATVGKTTFGKGIMQTVFEIPFKGIKGYIKLTTHTYITEGGKSYHEIGILPDVDIKRQAGTENISIEALTWEQDIQLQTAVSNLTAGGE